MELLSKFMGAGDLQDTESISSMGNYSHFYSNGNSPLMNRKMVRDLIRKESESNRTMIDKKNSGSNDSE